MSARLGGSRLIGLTLAHWKRSAAIAGVLAVSAVWGFAVEMLLVFDDYDVTLLVLTTVWPWALLLAVALAAMARGSLRFGA